jgi:hypothetical protein
VPISYLEMVNAIATSTLPQDFNSMEDLESEFWRVYLEQFHIPAQQEEGSY